MKEIYTKTFDKLHIADDSGILEALIEKNCEINDNPKKYSYKPKRRHAYIKRALAIACTVIALIMVLPYTRKNVLATIKYIYRELIFDNGEIIALIDEEDATAVGMTSTSLDENKWCMVNGDKIIFICDGKSTDITAYCSDKSFYRYEKTDSSSITHIVFVGGDIHNVGWAEFLFDENGNYLTNMMSVRTENFENPEWLINAEKSINVYYGE